MKFKVELEDEGQDLLYFITDENGEILDTQPFHNKLYKGGYIPLESQKINKKCMIHHPPYFNYGYLKYNVISITKIN